MARVDVGLTLSMKDRLSGPLRRLNGNLKKTERQGRRTARSFKSIDLVMGLMAAGTLIALTRGFLKMGSEMEQLRVRIGVMERSMSKVDGVMQQLNEQFGKAPFALGVITDGFVRMKASGLDPLDGSLKALIDGVAAFGGGAQELQRAGIAIQQMAGKGVISMEELRQQLGEAIPFAMRVMAKEMKISVAKLISEIERGRISADEGLGAFFRGLKKNFGGLSDALVFTMQGAFERVVKTVQKASDTIFNKFDIGTKIAVILNEVADGIEKFTAELDERKILAFFRAVVDFGTALFDIGSALAKIVGFFATFITDIVNLVGGDAAAILAIGAVGIMIFGPVGGLVALAGATVAIIASSLDSIEGKAKKFKRSFGFFASPADFKRAFGGTDTEFNIDLSDVIDESTELAIKAAAAKKKIAEIIAQAGFIAGSAGLGPVGEKNVTKLTRAIVGLDAKLRGAGPLPFLQQITRLMDVAKEGEDVFLRDAKSIDKLREALKKAQDEGGEIKVVEGLTEAINLAEASIKDALGLVTELRRKSQLLLEAGLEKVAAKVNVSIDKIAAKMKTIRQGLVADFGRTQELARIEQQFLSMEQSLTKQLEKAVAITAEDSKHQIVVDRITESLRANVKLRDQLLVRANQLKDTEERIFELQTRAANAALKRKIADIGRQTERFANPASVLFESERANKARELREQLQGQVEALRVQSEQIQKQITLQGDVNGVLAAQAGLVDRQIDALENMRGKVTEVALLQIELWETVSKTIRDTLGDAIKNLVTGTGTLKEALVAMFDRITEAAAQYIAKLIIMKALQAGVGAGFGGGGSGGFGNILGFGKGAAFKGNVKTFGKGDIVRGPTLFGLAGEAGTEAIMPLTRGPGGKLGVQASGTGGGGMNLTIQAIDQQSGAEFLLKHLSDIQGGFQQQKALNATGR